MGKTKGAAKNRKKKAGATSVTTGYEPLEFSSGDETSNKAGKGAPNKEEKQSFDHVSIFNSPVLSFTTMLRVIAGALQSCIEFAEQHWLPIVVSLLAILSFVCVPLPESIDGVSCLAKLWVSVK